MVINNFKIIKHINFLSFFVDVFNKKKSNLCKSFIHACFESIYFFCFDFFLNDSCKNLIGGNQQIIVKKIFLQNGVTFLYLLCLNSHNIQKLNTMAKAKKAAKKAKKATKKKATKKAAKKKKK